MKIKSTVLFSLCASLALPAAVLPPEKLLPADTLVVVTAPNFSSYRTVMAESCVAQLWRDPSMKPFTEKFLAKLKEEVMVPLERELGLKIADYHGLAQGQVTLALIQNEWQGKSGQTPDWIFLLDAGEKSSQLKTNLTVLKKRWTDSGKQVRIDKIRDVEFTTLITSSDELSRMLDNLLPSRKSQRPSDDEAEAKRKAEKIEVTLGQADSLLVAGSSKKVIERILARQAGAGTGSLSEQAVYSANHNALFREANGFVWINFKAFYEILIREAAKPAASPNSLFPPPSAIFSALGLNGLQSLAFSFRTAPDGTFLHFYANIPESARQGIFKVFSLETKDANPPPFVPADAVQFNRVRVNLQKAWTTLENLISNLSPAASGGLKLIFDSAGKEKDPNFDLRVDLIGNLGDDVITYQKNSRGSSPAELNSPPTLYLISSPNAEKLANAVKVVLASLGQGGGQIKEREFLGRKIFSKSQPAIDPADRTKTVEQFLHFSSSGGYVAVSADLGILEEYLRSAETKSRPLREMAGLNEAAQKVGGMGSGLFAFSNQSEQTRVSWDAMKKNPNFFSTLFNSAPVGDSLALDDTARKLKDWADFTLLPSFDNVSKYYSFFVYAGAFEPNGFSLKFFFPTPPQLNKK